MAGFRKKGTSFAILFGLCCPQSISIQLTWHQSELRTKEYTCKSASQCQGNQHTAKQAACSERSIWTQLEFSKSWLAIQTSWFKKRSIRPQKTLSESIWIMLESSDLRSAMLAAHCRSIFVRVSNLSFLMHVHTPCTTLSVSSPSTLPPC
jgi:hypothetical protein